MSKNINVTTTVLAKAMTREEALSLRAVGRDLAAWARPHLKAAAKAAILEARLALPYVAARPAVAAWVEAKAAGSSKAQGLWEKARYTARYQGEMIPTYYPCGYANFLQEVETKESFFHQSGTWPDMLGWVGDFPYPIQFPEVARSRRAKPHNCSPEELGFAYWSTQDRGYHDLVAAHSEVVKEAMEKAYVTCSMPLYRGAWLKDHLCPGEVVLQASVGCFTTEDFYAEQISSRNEGAYGYVLLLEPGARACSMDALHRAAMGESEWRIAPGTSFEVLQVIPNGHSTTAVIRVVDEVADRNLPYDRIFKDPNAFDEEAFEDLLDWEEDLLAMVK